MNQDKQKLEVQQIEVQIEGILKTLTLKEKVALLSGVDFWKTFSNEAKGVYPVVVTDGPQGVRIGNETSSRDKNGTATAFPTGSAMASTWDPALIREMGIALAEETRANKCDVLLGPSVNIMRVPVAGRNFENYSEDPFLAGKIGTGYVQGLQSRGIGASVKHFACNNQEVERTRGSSTVDERTLREIYLTAFEMIVKEANPWTVMCSYNRLNGFYTSENRHLLTEILKEEWGFDGVLVSDWHAVHSIFECVKAGMDLEMPGPTIYFGSFLEEAVKTWQIDEEVINNAVRRILRLSLRVREYKLAHPEDKGAFSNQAHKDTARKVAEQAAVLLKNSNRALPLNPGALKKLAVIGPCAAKASYSGGGSSIVTCEYKISPLEGLKELLGNSLELLYAQGCSDRTGPDYVANLGFSFSYQGEPGIKEEYFGNREFSGAPLCSSMVPKIDFYTIFTPPEVNPADFSVRWEADMEVAKSGLYTFHLQYQGLFQFFLDDALFMEEKEWHDVPPYPFYTIMRKEIRLEAGKPYKFRFEQRNTLEHERQAMILKAEYMLSEEEVNAGIEEALQLARQADGVVVFAGHASCYEEEGDDRPSLRLPGAQDRLITALCAAHPDTVVVLNTGSPVEMPWAGAAGAILQTHFFGQEGGRAVARVLTGAVNPSGKLTVTYPLRYQDNPTYINYPGNRQAVYGEGIFVGYRYYDYKEMAVLYPFGHGLSYTEFAYGDLTVTGSLESGDLAVRLQVKNCGPVAGAEVVQLYIRDLHCRELRPLKELKGFEKVFLRPGAEQEVCLPLNERSFSFYDAYEGRWVLEPGSFELLAGSSSRDIRLTHILEL